MRSKKGQDIVEWTLIVVFVSMVTIATMFAFAPNMSNILDYIAKSLDTVANQQQ